MKNSFADIRPFKMLRHLELSFVGCEYLLSILLKSPCLETLVLKVCLCLFFLFIFGYKSIISLSFFSSNIGWV